MKKLSGIFLFIIISLCFIQNSIGQDSTDHKRFKHFTDSIFSKIEFDKKNDSIEFYRKERGFRYIENIDSTLRALQKNKNQKTEIENKTDTGKRTDYSSINHFLASKGVTLILWILVISFVIFILYKFIFKAGFSFKRKQANSQGENLLDAEEDVSQFQNKLIEHEAAGRYNDAVRILFLMALHELSNKNLLHFAPEKTNQDYLKDLKGSPIKYDFASLIKTFEYCWYGKFNLSAVDYAGIKNNFFAFNNKLK